MQTITIFAEEKKNKLDSVIKNNLNRNGDS